MKRVAIAFSQGASVCAEGALFASVMSKGIRMAVAAVVTISALSVAHAQLGSNLVVNGSFEQPISDNIWERNPGTWFAGQSFAGWTVTQYSIDLKRCGVRDFAQGNAYNGLQFVDLNGTPGPGGIEQTIFIAIPGVYRLSFAMSGNIGPYGTHAPNLPRSMRVRVSQGATDVFNSVFTWSRANHPTHGGHTVPNSYSYD